MNDGKEMIIGIAHDLSEEEKKHWPTAILYPNQPEKSPWAFSSLKFAFHLILWSISIIFQMIVFILVWSHFLYLTMPYLTISLSFRYVPKKPDNIALNYVYLRDEESYWNSQTKFHFANAAGSS